MNEAWSDFGIIILTQFILFIVLAIVEKRTGEIPMTLIRGIIIGTVLGLIYDLILGKYFGFFSYSLGFDSEFILTNSVLSYGLFTASVLLIQKQQVEYFLIWFVLLIAIYETTNHFFPVWKYKFTLSPLPYSTLLLVGYSSGALFASFIAHRIFRHPFILNINNVKLLK